MKKLKFILLTIIWFTLGLTTQVAQAQNVQLIFDDKYFSSPSWNAIFGTNISDIYFNYNQNDWYWLFFIWTWITPTNTTLKIISGSNTYTVNCSWQLNGYYTTNFTDFWMFPLDSGTANKIYDTWINYITWWLFYECNKTGIYWYVEWKYWSNSENTLQIWAWLNDAHTNWANTSPLKLIYSTNFRNNNRWFSWIFLSNIVHESNVLPRFVRDVWIEQPATLTGTQTNPYYIVEAGQFLTNGLKIYAKTEKSWYTISYILTWFDTTWQPIYSTWFGLTTNNSNPPKLNNFYWYNYRNIPYVDGMASWTIIAKSWSTTLKTIWFVVSWADWNFHIEYNPLSEICTTWRIATISWANNPSSYQYQRWINTAWIAWTNRKYFTNERNGQAWIKLTNWTIITWESLYVNITNIDNTPPEIGITQYIPEELSGLHIKECANNWEQWAIRLFATDTWCAPWVPTIRIVDIRSQGEWSYDLGIPLNEAWIISRRCIASDGLWNESELNITITIENIPITWHDFIRSLTKNSNNRYTTSWDRKRLSNAHAWDCEDGSITAQRNACKKWWTISIIWTTWFIYTWSSNNTGYDECGFIISDWDGSTIITWRFYDCNNPIFEEICKPHATPEIISWTNFVEYENYENWTKKYTSWANVIVKLNAQWIDAISGYRVSCIQQEVYCTDLIEWVPNCNNNSMFCNKLNEFIDRFSGSIHKQPKICSNWSIKPARTEWKNYNNYTEDDTFNRNLITGSGCSVYDNIPYWSRDKWPRKFRVQIEDIQHRKSTITWTIIPVNYSTINEPPVLTWTSNEMCYETQIWTQVIRTCRSTQYANQQSFTAKIIANWATLNNWNIWLNYSHRNDPKLREILEHANYWKLLYFDSLNEWLISVVGN